MIIAGIEGGEGYLYSNGTDLPCRIFAIRLPGMEQSTVLVRSTLWAAMPSQLLENVLILDLDPGVVAEQ